ncbi:MEDS domain-containing protein [Ammoniphilus resinae]|uniref:MEDS domain-containing protein n=1 Tax=Ammoniphilus resinae TaxID=861532 RepID=A0ABS4GVY2_9BACL|nr:MEDS domain-containing protein [Ammoniphilus resinae]MBP1934434.1 hypothetical protein [Ammoniphilus resinae]
MIQLTKFLQVPRSTHILYFFEDIDMYLNNLLAYITAGVKLGHHLLVIENSDIMDQAKTRMNALLSEEEQKLVHYYDNHLYYRCYGEFHIQSILQHFGELVTSFLSKNVNIRTWAHVEWKKQDDISSKLMEFERLADCSVNDMKVMSVCAYSSSDISASFQTTMMRSHEYLMTDKEFVQSPLYRKTVGAKED